MKINSLLAGTLALVLIAGIASPSFADERTIPTLDSSEIGELLAPDSHNDIIYQNGNNPVPGTFAELFDDNYLADDFVLSESTVVTDAHFIFICTDDINCPNIEPLFYFILTDLPGEPDTLIDSGTAQQVQVMDLGGGDRHEVWFDFEQGVPLDGGVTYWFALKYGVEFEFNDPEPLMEASDVVTGNLPLVSEFFVPVPIEDATWSNSILFANDMWFQLTGDIIIFDEFCDIFPTDPQCVVGGEFLSIDSTALILAGAQTNAVWIMSALAVIGSVAFGALYVNSRKSENS